MRGKGAIHSLCALEGIVGATTVHNELYIGIRARGTASAVQWVWRHLLHDSPTFAPMQLAVAGEERGTVAGLCCLLYADCDSVTFGRV